MAIISVTVPTLDIGVLSYIGIVQYKEHSPEFFSIRPGTLCICQVIKFIRLKWAGHVAYMGQRGGANWVLVEKTEEKRALGSPGHRWDGNIKKDA